MTKAFNEMNPNGESGKPISEPAVKKRRTVAWSESHETISANGDTEYTPTKKPFEVDGNQKVATVPVSYCR